MKYIGKQLRRKSLTISGSSTLTVDRGADSGSTAIYTNNIQNGYPTSNNWQEGLEGSYFNNFDNTSHVSEILRFVAGIISHSIDTASPICILPPSVKSPVRVELPATSNLPKEPVEVEEPLIFPLVTSIPPFLTLSL